MLRTRPASPGSSAASISDPTTSPPAEPARSSGKWCSPKQRPILTARQPVKIPGLWPRPSEGQFFGQVDGAHFAFRCDATKWGAFRSTFCRPEGPADTFIAPFDGYVDNLYSTPYPPRETVAYGKGERYGGAW